MDVSLPGYPMQTASGWVPITACSDCDMALSWQRHMLPGPADLKCSVSQRPGYCRCAPSSENSSHRYFSDSDSQKLSMWSRRLSGASPNTDSSPA